VGIQILYTDRFPGRLMVRCEGWMISASLEGAFPQPVLCYFLAGC